MWLKEVKYPKGINEAEYEQVPDEDLWQDGKLKLDSDEIRNIIYHNVVYHGEWKIIRRIKNEKRYQE